MKHKLSLLLIIFVFGTTLSFATNIPIDIANQVAKNYFSEKSGIKQTNISFAEEITISENGINLYYIFNLERENGFIIISADDAFVPIIAYSLTNTFKLEGQPENISNWMQQYTEQIMYVKNNNLKASEKTNAQWEKYKQTIKTFVPYQNKEKGVDPLTDFIKFNQLGGTGPGWDLGWNGSCPMNIVTEQYCYTGCVATAMSIIMYYYKYPIQGTGEHQYYCYPYSTQYVNYGEATYMWSNMLDAEPTYYSALLAYHAGVSVDMVYGLAGSAAWDWDVPYAMQTYFGYSTTDTISRSSVTEEEWINNLLKPELDADRPVFHTGYGEPGGHAFICDGYDTDDNFHFNWGWAGVNNGFYTLEDVGGFNLKNQIIQIAKPENNYPESVTNFVAEVNSENMTNYQIDISWEAPNSTKNLTGYNFYIGEEIIEEGLPTNTLSYSDIIINPDDIIGQFYAVRAIYSDGVSLCKSAFVNTEYDLTFNFEDTNGEQATHVNITFDGVEKNSSFLSHYTFQNIFFGFDYEVIVAKDGYETITETINIVNKDIEYKVVLGESISLQVENANTKNINENIIIYPNPSKTGIFNIQNIDKNTKINLFDLTGKEIYSNILNSNYIDLSFCPAGIYNLQIITEQDIVIKKIIIQ